MALDVPVHPHVCGERSTWRKHDNGRSGSSPRVWGARIPEPDKERENRFIPTCVGSAGIGAMGQHSWTVHPHVCGERVTGVGFCQTYIGSSPRVWGAQRARPSFWRPRRFIPTCVGSARCDHASRIPGPVHPHVCGERSTPRDPCDDPGGSSPRVWGAHGVHAVRVALHRFIPTCVGSAVTPS